MSGFQNGVVRWVTKCFGRDIARSIAQRNHRFLEEALELVQSLSLTASEAHMLVDYVFSRPAGEPHQEVGGTMVTLAALCGAARLDMEDCAEIELRRIWGKMDQIRAKHATKPDALPPDVLTPDHIQHID